MTNIANNIQPALQSDRARTRSTDRRRDGPVLRLRRALQGLQPSRRSSARCTAPGSPSAAPAGQQLNSDQFLPSISGSTPPTSRPRSTYPALLRQPGPAHRARPARPRAELGERRRHHAPDGSTNSIPASPAPTFTLNFTNSGQNTENNVICKVTVAGSSVSGQTIVPQTTAGESTSCQVTLSSAPPKGSATLTATIVPVPGENEHRQQHADVPGHVPVMDWT